MESSAPEIDSPPVGNPIYPTRFNSLLSRDLEIPNYRWTNNDYIEIEGKNWTFLIKLVYL